MPSLRKVFFITCMIFSVFCLTAGYAVAGQWIGTVAAILMIPAWLFARKHSGTWLPYICLLASVSLAVIGKLTGAIPILMIFGSGITLAVWDLLLLDAALGNNSSGEQTRQYENKHLQSLALSLGFGLSMALLGRLLNFQIPFFVLLLFIVFTLFSLDRIWSYLKRRSNNN
jgi:hypothetical protein